MTTAVQEAVTGLLEAISTPLGRNDLGCLARMHSWAQSLGENPPASSGEAARRNLGNLAKSLVTLLERLILDEAAQPDLGIRLVSQAVQLIHQGSQGHSVDAEPLLARMKEAINGCPVAGAAPSQLTPVPAAPASETPPMARTAPEAQGPPPAGPAPETAEPWSGLAADVADEPYVSEPLVLDLNEREHLEGFLEEATEHMDAIEGRLLEVEADPTDTAKINELFRPFHTIKGIAGFLNLRDINRLTHEIEAILDLGRKSELRITAATVDLILAGVDVLKAQLDAIRRYLAGPGGGPCPQPPVAEIIARLRRVGQAVGTGSDNEREERPRLGEILVAQGVVAETEVEEALAEQSARQPHRKLGEILVEQGAVTASRIETALLQQEIGQPVVDQSIRVDTRKLDILVDAVGELVIAQSMVSLCDLVRGNEKLHRNVSQVNKIVRDVQETAMAMRMVPIGQTFQKMRRLVRDVARKAGKSVELSIGGEDTELDKNVIQQVSDPLVHMVRNAVDHGIELPEERRGAGKPQTGRVRLNAYHQGDSIVIEVRDDGRGLDRQKLVAKAIERGLIGPQDQLSDQQVFALILQPGFSTAEKVTEISGRGVGMDVVRRNVEQLRGKIEIHSEKGRGSLFCIRLPLTLAIIDGMLVQVGKERMIIPTILIEQSLRPEPRQITTVQRRGAMLQVRGELCPLIQLGPLFGYGPPIEPCQNLVVIVDCEGQKIALVLNELIGQQQVVIKTLGERFKQVKGVSGAAILGDGRVGLILEPTGLLTLYNRGGETHFPSRLTSPSPNVSTGVELQDSAASAQRTTVDQSGATPLPELATAPV
jgi:two-component system chemotaxis sensor kinase CheA